MLDQDTGQVKYGGIVDAVVLWDSQFSLEAEAKVIKSFPFHFLQFFLMFFYFFQINNFQILSGQQIRWSTFFSTLLGPLKKALARWPLSRLRLRDLFGGEWRWDWWNMSSVGDSYDSYDMTILLYKNYTHIYIEWTAYRCGKKYIQSVTIPFPPDIRSRISWVARPKAPKEHWTTLTKPLSKAQRDEL